MAYIPPSGWVEQRPHITEDGQTELGVFHRDRDCARIHNGAGLHKVDRPYTARRCRLCANELR
jgi:hypothetical protein